jgi:hypothetical protein
VSLVQDQTAHVVGDVDEADLCSARSMPTVRMNKPGEGNRIETLII